MFSITSKYFSIFNNKPPASWVAHVTRDFLTCYSCSYYSSMLQRSLDSFIQLSSIKDLRFWKILTLKAKSYLRQQLFIFTRYSLCQRQAYQMKRRILYLQCVSLIFWLKFFLGKRTPIIYILGIPARISPTFF